MKFTKRLSFTIAVVLVASLCATSSAFTTPTPLLWRTKVGTKVPPVFGFLGDKERDNLSRDSEPEEFFST